MRPAPPSLLPQTGTFTLYQRAEDLLKIANEMAAGQIDFSDDVHSRSERRKRGKIQRGELNRFRLLVDMLESDLEKFQLSDPAEYRKHYNPLIPYAKVCRPRGGLRSAIGCVPASLFRCSSPRASSLSSFQRRGFFTSCFTWSRWCR